MLLPEHYFSCRNVFHLYFGSLESHPADGFESLSLTEIYFILCEPPKVGNNSNETHANLPLTKDEITVENLSIPSKAHTGRTSTLSKNTTYIHQTTRWFYYSFQISFLGIQIYNLYEVYNRHYASMKKKHVQPTSKEHKDKDSYIKMQTFKKSTSTLHNYMKGLMHVFLNTAINGNHCINT